MTIEKVPPSSHNTERALLASMIIDKNALYQAIEICREDDFYSTAHKMIFQQINNMVSSNIGVDIITLSNALRFKKRLEECGGEAYLSELTEEAPTTPNISNYAKILKECNVRRKLIKAAREIEVDAYENENTRESIIQAERAISTASGVMADHKKVKPLSAILGDTLVKIETASKKDGITGVTTGIITLDSKIAGFQPGELYIIAARPSMGKSAFMLSTALNAWQIGNVSSAIFSLEMPEEQLAMRLISIKSGISIHAMRSGTLTQSNWSKVSIASGELYNMPIFIDDSTEILVPEIKSKVRRLVIEHNIGIAYIDYLQLIPHKGHKTESRNQELGIIMRGLKAISKEYKIPVVALSQLSREIERRPISKGQRKPRLSDLRDSGNIEQDADNVIFIYREYEYTGNEDQKHEAELIVGKQRNGPVGPIRLRWEGDTAHFRNSFDDSEECEQQEVWQDKF